MKSVCGISGQNKISNNIIQCRGYNLGQNKWEIYTPPTPPHLPPKSRMENGELWLLPSFILDLGGRGEGVCCSISFCPRLVSKKIASIMYSRLQITRTFKGNRKKVRVIGSSSYRDPEENSRE